MRTVTRKEKSVDIERLQIEGGFLDGFDVKFSDGLNVLIGARGTGKTSVIELIRFALGARNHTSEASERSEEHAEAVLADGAVSISLGDLLETVTVTRAAGEELPQASGYYQKPLVFSQTEIENLGLSEGGRLRLLDGFVSEGAKLVSDEASAVAGIRSIFKEIAAAEADRSNLAHGLDAVGALKEKIKVLKEEAVKHQALSADLEGKQKQLAAVTETISATAVREGVLERFVEPTQKWADLLSGLAEDDFGVEEWDPFDGDDPLSEVRPTYVKLVAEARALAQRFDTLAVKAMSDRETLAKARIADENKARSIRSEVEQSVAGAGTVSRQLTQAQTELAQLMSRRKIVEERDHRLTLLRTRRDERIKLLDTVRAERFSRRVAVAKSLSEALSPQIQVTVERYGQYAEYSKALTEALRGSGMRYTDLVTSITQSVSPQELVRFIDSNDFVSLSEIASIAQDRAARLLGHLRENGAADIVVASIEDNVRMSLLDGLDYKDVENLSAGQRCTVILSIVLQHTSRTLIIDQPEDHLDNAYIATTVIKAIRNRKAHGQLIISTHNANIPVLGGADLVVEMTSDGRNGYVQICEQLTNPNAVNAITNVMEGGREAFANRAAFYGEHEL
ncbi:AAA family ATPase [Donghicola tyrosinivorans]|uniref:AAA domain-containing protein n=1 Tax=Donghicola tyrosinivorans TaxID=1652492 RepID=A0A2T0WYG4_9RHOB|nr:AAA family ATPase [Donghicola tyrosinivorans]PRY91738.1 AAA domain-containing protein [Donghicola tyrosinivorans]